MLRRLWVALALVALVAVVTLAPAAAPAQQDGTTPATPSSPPPARAWVLADADTGAVLAALDHHRPLYIASLTKVMTAFVTMEQLQMQNEVRVSERAAAQPAMRIGMEAGQTWKLEHALHSLVMVSANDAAYALAEASAGSIEEFSRLVQRTGERLGMENSTWLDPAGLDGAEGFGGGTTASAYDLAILARNALDVPELAEMAGKQTYEFHGGDGLDHRLVNHNKMLATYPGLTGLKTGYTKAAGHTLIATAERDGRRLVAVVINAQTSSYDVAGALLDQGFAAPPDASGTGEVLPETSFSRAGAGVGAVELTDAEDAVEEAATASGDDSSALRRVGSLLLLVLGVAFFTRREQIKRRKRWRMARRRAYLDAKRRGMIDVIDAERYYGGVGTTTGHVQVYPGTRAGSAANGHHRPRRQPTHSR